MYLGEKPTLLILLSFSQPDISKYASEVLPLLFQYLLQVSQESDTNHRGLTRSYYALEMFCQNLGKDIEPYLPKLMEHLMTVLKTSPHLRPKELAISALGATGKSSFAKTNHGIVFHFVVRILNSATQKLCILT